MTLGPVVLPVPTLEIGAESPSTPADEVSFIPWVLNGGRVEFSTDRPEPARAWARACFDGRCGTLATSPV